MPVVRVACSPDADDLFMMRALALGLLDTGDIEFEIETHPTDALNRLATEGGADVVAISIAHYPSIADRYLLLPHGGSLGEGYGPVLVSKHPLQPGELAGMRVGVPGLTTTAWLTLQLAVPGVRPMVVPIVPHARVFEELDRGHIEAAVLIHEGRLTFSDHGLVAILDLGAWWRAETGLPLPLGGNCIRRGLDEGLATRVSELLRNSIQHALDHRDEAIDWLLARGTALPSHEAVDRYLAMYANERTLDYGDEGRKGIEALLSRAAAAGLVERVPVDFSP